MELINPGKILEAVKDFWEKKFGVLGRSTACNSTIFRLMWINRAWNLRTSQRSLSSFVPSLLPHGLLSRRFRPTSRTLHVTTYSKLDGSRSNSTCLPHLGPSWLPRLSPHHQGLPVPSHFLLLKLLMPPALQAVLLTAPWRCSPLGPAQKRR